MGDPWTGKQILVVDDSPSARERLIPFFKEMGLQIVGKASSGLEAIKLVEELSPDIVSLDIIMPEMDGIECYRFLVKKHPNLHMLFVSSLASEPRVVQSYANEIPSELFLAKPFSADALRRTLEYVYSGKAALHSLPAALLPEGEPPTALD